MSDQNGHGELPFSLDDLAPYETPPFVYAGHTYVLRECPESGAKAYRSMQLRNARMVDGKLQADLDQLYASQPFLVSQCLIQILPDGRRSPVKQEVVLGFGSRAVKRLFERSRDISGLNEEAETVDSLKKQIARLQAKLEKLEAAEASGTDPNPTSPGESILSLPAI